MDDIRILFDCDVKSGLKKQDMALAVADYFLNESEYWMRRLPCTEIQNRLSVHRPDPGCRAGQEG